MPNLITKIGYEYADQFYKKALFMLDGDVYSYGQHITEDKISCNKVVNVDGIPKWEKAQLKNDQFPSMDVFAWPRPGYRQFKDRKGMLHVYYFSSLRSAMRGLKPEFIELNPVSVLEIIPNLHNPRDYTDSAGIAQTIFKPEFTPFLEGMRKLRSGEAAAFAISPDVAVALSVYRETDGGFDVMFRERVIGQVLDGDIVQVPHRFFKRSSSNTLFNGRVIR